MLACWSVVPVFGVLAAVIPQFDVQMFCVCNHASKFVLGMFQRLDRMRKHSFGSMGLFGTNNNSQIAGLWVWRGQELAFELSEDLQIDYESYKWTKLDPDSEETKKLIVDFFNLDDSLTYDGKKLCEGKIFK